MRGYNLPEDVCSNLNCSQPDHTVVQRSFDCDVTSLPVSHYITLMITAH